MRFSFTSALLLLVLAASVSFAQTPQPTPASDGSKSKAIPGRVVNESGQPLSGAFVLVRPVGPSGPTRRDQFASSDRDGYFKIDNLEPVSYLVEARLPAYTTQPREPDTSPPPQYRPGDSVTLVLTKGGVITGTVTKADGEPVIGIGVSARMVRDRNGQRRPGLQFREVPTDDRGVYRIYGLPAGTYIAMADGANDYSLSGVNAFSENVPTYAPSSTRDTAAEITVRHGEEISNVDIRYRGERGRTISGIVTDASNEGHFAVKLHPVTPTGQEWHVATHQFGGRAFAFDGIPDGDYFLTAVSDLPDNERRLSESKLINLRGADVTGLELTTQPLGEITGKVVAEESKAVECSDKSPPAFTEMTVSAWHRDLETNKRPQFVWSLGAPARLDAQGKFRMRWLAASDYYFQTRVAGNSWYLKSIGFTPPRPADATRVWTNVKSGERLSGLTLRLAQGAASFSGKFSEAVAEKLFVFLVPVETERADEPLRFYGGPVTNEGKVALNNLAPGRYWVLVQPVIEETVSPLVRARLPDATRTRARIRREAEAAKTEVELKACQQIVDFALPR